MNKQFTIIFSIFSIFIFLLILFWISYNSIQELTPKENKINPNLPLPSVKSDLVKFIHQSWRTHSLPHSFNVWSESWRRCYPQNWQYKLWSDEENRELIRRFYPWFLSTYDSFPQPIHRADMMRAFYMHHFGGIYADLDAECLRPFPHLIENAGVVFGAMAGYDRDSLMEGYTQNSFMYSRRGHPIWMIFIHDVLQIRQQKNTNTFSAGELTGPTALMKSIKRYREVNEDDILIYPPIYFNPFSWLQKTLHPACKDLNQMNKKEYQICRNYFVNSSYVVQYHSQSWKEGESNLKSALKDRIERPPP